MHILDEGGINFIRICGGGGLLRHKRYYLSEVLNSD